MKRKLVKGQPLWKKGVSAALACMMAVTMLPAFSFSARAEGQENELLKAGSIPASAETVTQNQPLATGTAGSTQFRIPVLISLRNGGHRGNIVVAADARYSTNIDGGGLDTIASVSTDMGNTWNYSFPIYFPDSDGYAGTKATTAIDPALVEGPDGTIYCIADMNPTGVTTYGGFTFPGRNTGYVEIDGTDRLALTSNYSKASTLPTESDTATYAYYVGDFNEDGYAPVLNRSDNQPTIYGVDEWYNLYTVNSDGNYEATLTQSQVNSSTTIQQNVFYKDSVLHVYNTGYIWMVESKDGGLSWVNPRILNPDIKREDETALLVSPGKGITMKNGTIVVPFYNHYGASQEAVSFIYSKDNGATWRRTDDVKRNGTSGWTSESETVELSDGTLRTFSRNGGGTICYSDAAMDENGDYSMGTLVSTGVSCRSECNVTAVTYSKKIDGKEAILVACPSTRNSRTNGKIYTFLVNEDKTLTLKTSMAIPADKYGTEFAYSCIDELSDGSIGIFFEPKYQGVDNQQCIYHNFEISEITGEGGKEKISLTDENPSVSVNYAQVAASGNVTQQPNAEIASVSVQQMNANGYYLCSYQAANASNLSSFASEADITMPLEDCEFTFTQTAENVYTVQSVKTGKYWHTDNPDAYFGDSATALKVVSATVNGNTVFRICLNSSGRRYVVFFPEKMYFDAFGDYDASATNVSFDMALLEKQDSVSDSDTIPGYKRVSSITSGKKYLVSYVYDGNYIVLYPEGGRTNCTKLAKQTNQSGTTVTFTKGSKNGVTEAVVDGKTYKIMVNTDAASMKLGKGVTRTMLVDADAVVSAEGITCTVGEPQQVAGLMDHNLATGFEDYCNEALSLEKAELVFTGSGSTYTIKVKNLEENSYLTGTSARYWATASGNVAVQKADGVDGAYNFCVGTSYNTNSRHMCFDYTTNTFNSNGTRTEFNGTYDLLLLEKKGTVESTDVIPGYKKVNTIVSGNTYIMAAVAQDGSVCVLYPNKGTQAQTKKYINKSLKSVSLTAGEYGSASLAVGNKYYDIEIICAHNDVTVEGAVEASCEESGLTGTMTCNECGEKIADSAFISKKGHWYDSVGTVTQEMTDEADGVLSYFCGLDHSHAKTEIIPRNYREVLTRKAAEAESKLAEADNYTATSIQTLQAAYNATKDVTDSTPIETVQEKLDALIDAIHNLKTPQQEKAEEEREAALKAGESIYSAGQANYTPESWAVFKAAYEALQGASENMSAVELEGLTAKLKEAQNKLAQKPSGGTSETPKDEKPNDQKPSDEKPSDEGEIKVGQVYDSGNYYYKVTSTSKMTAEVTGLKKKSIKNITIYNTVTLGGKKYKITSVASSAFKNNKKITSVKVQKHVEVIGNSAFAGCTNLKKVEIKSTKLKNIGSKAFSGCKKLSRITIKSKVLKKAGKNAFKGISKKAVIKVPAAKLKAYTKILAKKGQSGSVKIKK